MISDRSCRVCGCTDSDCRGCIERTGLPCYWISNNLCSACDVEGPPPSLVGEAEELRNLCRTVLVALEDDGDIEAAIAALNTALDEDALTPDYQALGWYVACPSHQGEQAVFLAALARGFSQMGVDRGAAQLDAVARDLVGEGLAASVSTWASDLLGALDRAAAPVDVPKARAGCTDEVGRMSQPTDEEGREALDQLLRRRASRAVQATLLAWIGRLLVERDAGHLPAGTRCWHCDGGLLCDEEGACTSCGADLPMTLADAWSCLQAERPSEVPCTRCGAMCCDCRESGGERVCIMCVAGEAHEARAELARLRAEPSSLAAGGWAWERRAALYRQLVDIEPGRDPGVQAERIIRAEAETARAGAEAAVTTAMLAMLAILARIVAERAPAGAVPPPYPAEPKAGNGGDTAVAGTATPDQS